MNHWLAALFALGVPAAASAAAPSCAIPAGLERPHAEGPSASQPARTVPITRYTLALIWTPQHCHAAVGGAGAYRCEAGDAGRGFTLHGLWPDGDNGSWPQWCKPTAILSPSVIRAHYCATPSPQLLQHEWAKHGTCIAGATPERFFALSNRLFAKLRTPDMSALAARPSLTAADVAGAFAAANRGLATDAIRLNLSRDGWLEEVWICLDKGYKAETCPADQGGVFGSRPVRIAPQAVIVSDRSSPSADSGGRDGRG